MTAILVANRGEIAVRVLKTAHQLGYRTVAVHSEADRGAPHTLLADVAVEIGPAAVSASYLNVEAVLDAARRTGADAIHPGYGFLSENADFARAVVDAGLTWIGPPADAIEAMGDKKAAKTRMQAAGVPCVPGASEATLEAAREVGFPLLVKASAGGGGRGMRRVYAEDEFEDAVASARAEAENAFGDGTLLLERLVLGARHIEVQVFGDQHGRVVHLGERDCSVQRRHQKVIEESPGVGPDLRERMGEAACAAARAVGYIGAGTVEFLVEGDDFYFLEMNTRLQVEHPVTEAVTGLDLVALQLQVADGEPLPPGPFPLSGHAIEVRLYAEDPTQGYLPQPGPVWRWQPPTSVRVDAGLAPRGEISAHYDPMVAKLISHGRTREEARRRMLRALDETVFFGVRTNRDLLVALLTHPDFVTGAVSTDFLDTHPELCEAPIPDPAVTAAAIALWHGGPGFRSGHPARQPFSVELDGACVDGVFGAQLTVAGASYDIAFEGDRVRVDGVLLQLQCHREGDLLCVRSGATEHRLCTWREDATSGAGKGSAVCMPMPGQVLAVHVGVGDAVEAGQVLAIVEAMKLETPLKAPRDGVVAVVAASVGDALGTGALVVELEEQE